MAVISLHGQEVVNDLLGDLLRLFRDPALGGDGDEVRALGVLDAADDFLVGFRDLPELAEIDVFFFL